MSDKMKDLLFNEKAHRAVGKREQVELRESAHRSTRPVLGKGAAGEIQRERRIQMHQRTHPGRQVVAFVFLGGPISDGGRGMELGKPIAESTQGGRRLKICPIGHFPHIGDGRGGDSCGHGQPRQGRKHSAQPTNKSSPPWRWCATSTTGPASRK